MPPTAPIAEFESALTALAGKPAPVAQPPEIAAVWAFTGVEVALARDPIPPRSLERVWGDRRGKRATPLLLVAPGEVDRRVVVVGPVPDQPLREVDPGALASAVAAVRTEPASRAGRDLPAALDSLAARAIPGVEVRGLLTDHFVRARLPRQGQWVATLTTAAAPATGKTDWRDALGALGYSITDRGHEGYLAREGQRPLVLIHAKKEPSEFARMDEFGRLPEGKLISECQEEKVPWGIMAAGPRIRLFQSTTGRGAATERWIDLDLRALDDRQYLVGLLAPSALSEGGLWPALIEESQKFGAELKERLDGQIRRWALPNIAQGLGEYVEGKQRRSLDDPEVRREIQRATYTLLFRLLFVMYAESAGHLAGPGYDTISLRRLCNDARARRDKFDARSRTLWNRLQTLTKAIREGDSSVGLPQYNGSLFAADDLPGADLLEAADVSDALIGPALDALGFDYEGDDDIGLDYTDLDIAHLGGIYEGLLALRLSRADQTYAWKQKDDRFVPSDEPGDYGVETGQLFFQTEAGGRKGGGVYYTRQEFVRHLVNHSVLPALDEHLEQVKRLAATDADAATSLLFRFRVLDPAMGSGHFLVDALDVIAERVQTFLAEVSLPPLRRRLDLLKSEAGTTAAEDGQLLKRLLLKHCVYGVDLQEMAVELARVALWLASFVPGLALSYLDQNLKRGDSLIGVANVEVVLESSGRGPARAFWGLPGGLLDRALAEATAIAAEIADLADRTKEEVERSRTLRAHLDTRLAGVRRVFNLWVADPFGVRGARTALLQGDQIIEGRLPEDLQTLVEQAELEAARRSFFHWPLEFPEVFHRSTERNPGFDAVIGNPPWDKLRVETLNLYAIHEPRLRSLSSHDRSEQILRLHKRFPALAEEVSRLTDVAATQRKFFKPENGWLIQGGGDLDLYELFCERYRHLGRLGGYLGVVLPRSALALDGSRGFRRWLFSKCDVTRIDLLLNKSRWAFDMEDRYTIALIACRLQQPPKGTGFWYSGPATSLGEFLRTSDAKSVRVVLDLLAAATPPPANDKSPEPGWELPIIQSADFLRLMALIATNSRRLDSWLGDHGKAFPYRELDESADRPLFSRPDGVPVWKGRCFSHYDPHGREPIGYADWPTLSTRLQDKRTASQSKFRGRFSGDDINDPRTHPIERSRIAFRRHARATDSRTAIACLVPPRTPLTDSAPYFAFPCGSERAEAELLGILNSLVMDWYVRRLVETDLNYFILDALPMPTNGHYADQIVGRAARLSCLDKRFTDFAKAMNVNYGALSDDDRANLRAETDALVACAYGLEATDLDVVFSDFPRTSEGVSDSYRDLVRAKFAEFSTASVQTAKSNK